MDMRQLLVNGGSTLCRGEVTVQGAKNSVLPILAATLLTGGQCGAAGLPAPAGRGRLHSDPAGILGCTAQWEGGALVVDTAAAERLRRSPTMLMREMRSSVIFLGAILARCGQAELSYPGGCELGPRPIDLHLSGLRDLGAEIWRTGGMLHCRAEQPAADGIGAERCLSVGATENAMLAACGAEGDHSDLQRRPGAGDRGSAGVPATPAAPGSAARAVPP